MNSSFRLIVFDVFAGKRDRTDNFQDFQQAFGKPTPFGLSGCAATLLLLHAAKNLFAPLGILRYYWKRTPSGLVDSEGGAVF